MSSLIGMEVTRVRRALLRELRGAAASQNPVPEVVAWAERRLLACTIESLIDNEVVALGRDDITAHIVRDAGLKLGGEVVERCAIHTEDSDFDVAAKRLGMAVFVINTTGLEGGK